MAIFDWEWGRNWAPRDGQKIPCLTYIFFALQLKDQLTSSKMYCLELPGTPKSLESHTPTSEDLPPYDTPPLSASHSSKEDCFNGILI